ncbi:DUF927 domain-containing protein [Roseinatronobacter sp. NSM]|uniref:DUF927 domain-containing protein n=1 Tax=Roseinatronobacter sp. NSM TaxID=3457785 RepID=UPI004036D6F9
MPVLLYKSRDDHKSIPEGFSLRPNGLFSVEYDENGLPRYERICDWICVTATTRDDKGQGFGRLVEFKSVMGDARKLVIDASRFASGSSSIIAELLSLGLRIERGSKRKAQLLTALEQWIPANICTTTPRRGWLGDDCFVLPDSTVAGNRAVHYTGRNDFRSAAAQGNLESWNFYIGDDAHENPLMMTAISLAFLGPLIEPLGLEPCGLHLRGHSSSGKSTIAAVATSVWFAPDGMRRWRTTDNGLEAIAESRNSMVLVLDELAEIDGKAADAAAYMLGNGEGKARSTARGGFIPQARWALTILSTGEISFRAKLAEAGRNIQAGQLVRFLDVPADTGRFAAFENLHGSKTGRAFSDMLKHQCTLWHGTAGPEFVLRFLEKRDKIIFKALDVMAQFHDRAEQMYPNSGSGVVGRARAKFAAIAAAGECAVELGVVNWYCGEPSHSSLVMFQMWREGYLKSETGGVRDRSVDLLQDFLMQNEHRIQDAEAGAATIEAPIAWRKGGYYYLPRETWEALFTKEQTRETLRILHDKGLFEYGDGRNLGSKLSGVENGPSRALKISEKIRDVRVSEMSDVSEEPCF